MAVQMAATSLFALVMAAAVMSYGLAPLATTINGRLAVFTGQGSGFGDHARDGGIEGLAGLLPR